MDEITGDDRRGERVRVTLLTQADCGFCDEAKELLERLSRDYPMRVVTEDLGTPTGQELATSGGVLFPPGIFLDGEPFSYGRPSERKLRRELAKRLA